MRKELVNGLIEGITTKDDLIEVIHILRPIAVNNKSSEVLCLIKKALKISKCFDDTKLTLYLYDLQIRQIYHLNDNLKHVCELLSEMNILAKELRDDSCNALVKQLTWHIEKLNGNKKKSLLAINDAIRLVNEDLVDDLYTLHFVKYSYAIEEWLSNHNSECSLILEECLDYFFKGGFYRSFSQTIAVLGIIYTRLQNSQKILGKSKSIIANKIIFERLPSDVKAISYYFVGLGFMLNLKLNFAESYFQKSYKILKPIYKESIYFSNFIILHSHMVTVKALQGKIDQACEILKKVEDILKQEFFKKNLNSSTKKQIYHTLNLNKFYVHSRLIDYDSEEMKDLIEEILIGSKTLYSNFMLLNEYILNSNLSSSKLKELMTTDNFSINRIKHIISIELLKRTKEYFNEQRELDIIEVLKNREKTTETTFTEDVFADLLIAQQLFSLKRYKDIYPLLVKYKNQLDRIEVLELRIFMEAFIQVGAYKIGDPLGPALQYMAIKKCRQYGFSKMENILLNYLNTQRKEVLQSLL